MAAYLVGHITVRDAQLWRRYVEGVGLSLLPFGAEILFRAKKEAVLAGEHPSELTVVIRFPDRSHLRSWFESEAYQSLIPLRDRAADVTIVAYDEI